MIFASMPAAIGPAAPPVLAAIHAFRGRVTYTAREDGSASPPVQGVLVIGNGIWQLDEQTPTYRLHADNAGASMQADGRSIEIDDVLSSEPLADGWSIALGTIATKAVTATAVPGVWSSGDLRMYLDPTSAMVAGVSDRDDGVSFTFGEWIDMDSIPLPSHILRMRGNTPSGAFTIDGYRVIAASPAAGASRTMHAFARTLPVQAHGSAPFLIPPIPVESLGSGVAALLCLLVLAFAAIVFTRRELILQKLCRRLAEDPRGWRRAGVTLWVQPDGVLTFKGVRYRVGPHFYGRAALVQESALFLRVSAPAVPRAVIMPRKFRPRDRRDEARAATRLAGFTLVETLFATSMFAAIVLLAVYPAMTAVARASAMAAEREQAAIIAADALSDEESADAYNGGAPQGSASSVVDGLELVVTVSPGAVRGEADLDISVSDPGGTVLAHVTSWLGLPVASPAGGEPPSP